MFKEEKKRSQGQRYSSCLFCCVGCQVQFKVAVLQMKGSRWRGSKYRVYSDVEWGLLLSVLVLFCFYCFLSTHTQTQHFFFFCRSLLWRTSTDISLKHFLTSIQSNDAMYRFNKRETQLSQMGKIRVHSAQQIPKHFLKKTRVCDCDNFLNNLEFIYCRNFWKPFQNSSSIPARFFETISKKNWVYL